MLNSATDFSDNICDGFVKPNLAWCATTPEHLDGVGGSSIGSNFWIGSPSDIKSFAEEMIARYQKLIEKNEWAFDEYESLSVLYWENENIAMCADMSTGDEYCDSSIRKLAQKYPSIEYILQDGNDNSPNAIIDHDSLEVEKRLALLSFMNADILKYYFDPEYQDEHTLKDYSEKQKAILEAKYNSKI